MTKKITILMELLNKSENKITFSEILKKCILEKNLPSSKGEIYFLISTLKALDIFEDLLNDGFKINWEIYEKLKGDGSI